MQYRDRIVEELSALINKGSAHTSFEEAVAGVSLKLLNVIPDHLPYSIWQLVSHIRIAQWDMLCFCRDKNHQSPAWPEEYWPKAKGHISAEAWEALLKLVRQDRAEFLKLLADVQADLFTPFPYGKGQSLFQEALQIADHNAYHTGEIVVIRRLLGDWKS